MSGVYEKDRSLSEPQWVMTARIIRVEIDQLAHSDKVIPKSWRFTHAVPLCEEARSLVFHVRAAYRRYPNTARLLLQRKDYFKLALDDCDDLVEDLQELKDCGLPINLNRFDRIAGLLNDEIALLTTKYKNAKLIGGKSVEERIAKKEIELAELREVMEQQIREQE